jgi:hypothetical protein
MFKAYDLYAETPRKTVESKEIIPFERRNI